MEKQPVPFDSPMKQIRSLVLNTMEKWKSRLTQQLHAGYCLPKKGASPPSVPSGLPVRYTQTGRRLRLWNGGHVGLTGGYLRSRWPTFKKEVPIIYH